MLKTGLLVLLTIIITEVYGQISYTYTFDSSVLSILLGKNEIMNAYNSKYLLDMKDKWRYTQTDSVTLEIRGFYINDQIDTNLQKSIRVKCKLFGNRFTQQIQPGAYIISRVLSLKSIQKHPYIKFTATTLKRREKDSFIFDSFDFMAVIKSTN